MLPALVMIVPDSCQHPSRQKKLGIDCPRATSELLRASSPPFYASAVVHFISTLQFLDASDIHTEIHDEDLGILSGTDDAPIV